MGACRPDAKRKQGRPGDGGCPGKINDSLDTSSLGEQLVTIRSLQERWNQLGNDLAEKKKFITDNKDEFDKLGVSVSNVDEAENALVTNTEAFIQAMTLRAEAAAAFKLAAEEAEKALKAQTEIDRKKKEGPSWKDKAVSFLFLDPQWTRAPCPTNKAHQGPKPSGMQVSGNRMPLRK